MTRIVIVLAAILPFVFPSLWVLSSYRTLGDPLAFTMSTNPLYRHYTWNGMLRYEPAIRSTLGGHLRDALTYLQLVLQMAFPFLPLALMGVFSVRRRRFIAGIVALAILLGLWMVVGFMSGITGNRPQRVVMPLVAVLGLLAGAVAWWIATRLAGRFKARRGIILSAAFFVLCIIIVGRHYHYLRKQIGHQMHSGLDSSAITAGWRLCYELGEESQVLKGISHKTPIHVWTPVNRAAMGEFYAIQTLSEKPWRFIYYWKESPDFLLNDRNVELLLTADLPEEMAVRAGFRLLLREGAYVLWARPSILGNHSNPEAQIGGTAQEPTYILPYQHLEWVMKAPEGEMGWSEAKEYAGRLAYGGHDDWRLPKIEELWFLTAYTLDNEPGYDIRLTPRQISLEAINHTD
ncbi:MAG: hypothetical protein NT106_14205 [Candidatus Sumerlaeota bacterium]|nr:hypothetical protein [Candidatus Sumerlaeota bacterium]